MAAAYDYASNENQVVNEPGKVTKEEYEQRLDVLRKEMERKGIDVALLYYSRDLFYFSGTALYCTLIIPRENEPVLLVRINLARARDETWIRDVRDSASLEDVKEVLRELNLNKAVIGIEEDVTPLAFYKNLVKLLPEAQFTDISQPILHQRMIKSTIEIELIRKAADISNIGLEQVKSSLLRGEVSEIDLAADVEAAKRRAGHEGVMVFRRVGTFSDACFVISGSNLGIVSGYWIAIVGSGPSSALPYGASSRKIRRGDLVDINHGTMFQGYYCDEGKMYVLGKATEEQKRLFGIVRRSQDAAISRIKPGVSVSEVYKAAKQVVEDEGYGNYFMAYGQYGVEYLGHGVGLEIFEPPLVSPHNPTILKEGMTLALEPKLIIPGWGGVDIEDTLLVTSGGCELLTKAKRELVEVGAEL